MASIVKRMRWCIGAPIEKALVVCDAGTRRITDEELDTILLPERRFVGALCGNTRAMRIAQSNIQVYGTIRQVFTKLRQELYLNPLLGLTEDTLGKCIYFSGGLDLKHSAVKFCS